MIKNFLKRINIIKISVSLGIVFSFAFVTNVIGADKPWTHVIVMYNGTTGSSDVAQYQNWSNNIPGTAVSVINSNGMGSQAAGTSIMNAIASQPDALNTMTVWTNHGVVGGMGTDTALNKDTQVQVTTQAYENMGVSGQTIIDSCGSGAACWVSAEQLMKDGANNNAVFTTADGNDYGYYPFMGPQIDRNYINSDTNKDGVVTAGELAAVTGKPSKVADPDAPVFASSREKMEEYIKQHGGYCGVVKPGQDEEFGKMWGTSGIGAYDTKKDINGKLIKDKDKIESELNFKLRKDNFGCLNSSQVGGTTDSLSMPGCDPGKKDTSNYEEMKKKAKGAPINWVSGGEGNSLSKEQAETALKQALHGYKVPSEKVMQPNLYIKGTTAYDVTKNPVLVRRTDCVFSTPPSPAPLPSYNPGTNQGGNQGGQPGGGQPGGGQPGGGNQGGQQGNGTNTSPTPVYFYTTPTPTTSAFPVVCPDTYAPVCDTNGETQPNQCIAVEQKGLTLKHTGACTDNDRASISDLSDLIKQAISSGVPEDTITSIIQAVTRLFTVYINGTFSNSSDTAV